MAHSMDRMSGCPIHDIKQKLKTAGLRPTRQRLGLGWLLFGRGDRHLSAESLFEEAQRAKMAVSLATVYNTLNQFTQNGLLKEISIDGFRTFFDTNIKEHHHFFMEDEEKLVDIPASSVAVSHLPPPPDGMEVSRVEVIIRVRKK